MTGAQIRAGRAMLGLSQAQVAHAAGVSVPTVKRAEGQGAINASAEAIAAIRAALEAAGVIFTPENGNGPGVALKKTSGASMGPPKVS